MTRTNKILASVVAVALAAFAFYHFALAPQREEAARLDGELAKKTEEFEAAKAQLSSYEQARASYKRNYATLARLGKAVPADDDVRSLLVQLEVAADRSGVDFAKIELSGGAAGATPPAGGNASADSVVPGAVPIANGALSALPFNLTFTGSYFDLSSFLARLEHFVTVNNRRMNATGRLLRLESVAITPAASGFPDMQAQIAAATYMVPPVEGVEGAEPSAPGATPPTTTASAITGATR